MQPKAITGLLVAIVAASVVLDLGGCERSKMYLFPLQEQPTSSDFRGALHYAWNEYNVDGTFLDDGTAVVWNVRSSRTDSDWPRPPFTNEFNVVGKDLECILIQPSSTASGTGLLVIGLRFLPSLLREPGLVEQSTRYPYPDAMGEWWSRYRGAEEFPSLDIGPVMVDFNPLRVPFWLDFLESIKRELEWKPKTTMPAVGCRQGTNTTTRSRAT